MTGRDIFIQVLSELSGQPMHELEDVADDLLAELPIAHRIQDEMTPQDAEHLFSLLRKEQAKMLGLLNGDDETYAGHA